MNVRLILCGELGENIRAQAAFNLEIFKHLSTYFAFIAM